MIPEAWSLPITRPALKTVTSVRFRVSKVPFTFSITIVSPVMSLIIGVGTPLFRAAAIRRASAVSSRQSVFYQVWRTRYDFATRCFSALPFRNVTTASAPLLLVA